MPRGDRRRQAGAAGADHQHVAFVGFLFVARHAIRPVLVSWAFIWMGKDWPVNRAKSEIISAKRSRSCGVTRRW